MRIGEYHDNALSGRATYAWAEDKTTPSATDPRATEAAALAGLGFSKPLIRRFITQADRNGTTIEAELLADGVVREDAYFASMARYLRLPFLTEIDPRSVVDTETLDVQLLRPNQIRLGHARAAPQVAIAPEAARLVEFAALLDRLPAVRNGLVITTPSQIRKAVWTAGGSRRVQAAVSKLFDTRATCSARIVLSGAQGFAAGCGLSSLVGCILVLPAVSLIVLHCLLSFAYLGSLLLRAFALLHGQKAALPAGVPPPETFPIYTIMVALYREVGVAEQLVRCLERIDWPRSRLDIKLICEADDLETITALEGLSLAPHFEIVRVPPCQPRTKPKALSYALGAARGDFLVIYDAEDRPHPKQLREAFNRFRDGPDELACLQAPLVITNGGQSCLSAIFALEYSALFRALLPMLAELKMPLPLGGTSNHFRTAALRDVGGWDPFNVTEDADLGIRLYRHGYRAGTLQLSTLEDAPTEPHIWLGQRTRWYKGWLQTWLVTVRNPRMHLQQMGIAGAFVFHLMIGGMLGSALLHPLILVFIASGLYAMFHDSAAAAQMLSHPLLFIDAINIVGSYLIFIALGRRGLSDRERQQIGWRWMTVPLYWMLTSFAAWKAVNELRSKPFFWNKTPHKPVERPTRQ